MDREPPPEAFAPPAVREVSDLEGDIRDAINARPLLPATPALPDYVAHDSSTPAIGMMTAEAVVQGYELTAKAIEAMSEELTQLHRRAEAEIAEIHKVQLELQALAQAARDKGKEAFEQVEKMSRVTADVRTQIDEMKIKIFAAY